MKLESINCSKCQCGIGTFRRARGGPERAGPRKNWLEVAGGKENHDEEG